MSDLPMTGRPMTKRDLMELAIKIIGVICTVMAVSRIAGQIAGILMWIQSDQAALPRGYSPLGFFAVPSVLIGMGLVLLLTSEGLAGFLVRSDQPIPILTADIMGKETFALAVKVIGVLLIVRGLTHTATFIMRLTSYDPGNDFLASAGCIYLVNAVLYGSIGFYFLSGARRLVNFAYRDEFEPPTGSPAGEPDEGRGAGCV